METEIWPNLLAACRACDAGRACERADVGTLGAWLSKWNAVTRPAFASLARACAQSDADARRLVDLGAKRVSVCGNLKFDIAPDAAQVEAGRAWKASLGRPVLLIASTREGEERLLVEALASTTNPALAIVVPRHPQRFDAVAALLGESVRRRSRGEDPLPGDRLFLGDTMGEMAFYYCRPPTSRSSAARSSRWAART
jgi:3-deoxy-D-manno-octulosonic-acid transferase